MADCRKEEISFHDFPQQIAMKLMVILINDNILLENWTNLAVFLNASIMDITNLESEFKKNYKNPVKTLLKKYSCKPESSVEKFLKILNKFESRNDLNEIKEEIREFINKKHCKRSFTEICLPTEDNETLFLGNIDDKDLKQNISANKSEVKVSYNQQHSFSPLFSPRLHIRKYSHPCINTTINDIESDVIFNNSNDNSHLYGELRAKGYQDLESNHNVSISNSSTSFNSMPSDLTNNSTISYIPNFPRHKPQGVNILPKCPTPKVISIDSSVSQVHLFETKIPKTTQNESSRSHHSYRRRPISSLNPDIPEQEHISYQSLSANDPDERLIFLTYADDIRKRAKKLAIFLRQEKYSHLKVTLVDDCCKKMTYNFRKWVDYYIDMANIIVVIISPKYKQDLDFKITDDSDLVVRYIADQLHNQYVNNGCNHIKARVILFKSDYKKYIPEFLKSTIPFSYQNLDERRQFLKMVTDHQRK